MPRRYIFVGSRYNIICARLLSPLQSCAYVHVLKKRTLTWHAALRNPVKRSWPRCPTCKVPVKRLELDEPQPAEQMYIEAPLPVESVAASQGQQQPSQFAFDEPDKGLQPTAVQQPSMPQTAWQQPVEASQEFQIKTANDAAFWR